ncbi:MMPL family transporter [bacterium]|nr:MMPL family transporter [bacterium]
MFLKISKHIINHGLLILTAIFILTSLFFYQAFVSEDRLKIDFSIEQMFPTQDPDKDYYEKFKSVYGREDNTIFLSYTNDNLFSNENLSIVEMLSEEMSEIKNIDYVFSLGSLWEDGDGKIGEDLAESERLNKILSNRIYSGLLSKDNKSSLIILKINENIYSHDERKQIFSDIESVKNNFIFNIAYDGIDFEENSSLNSFYNQISDNSNDLIYVISNKNVLSEYSVGPYSILNSLEYQLSLDNNDFELFSINDCYNKVNSFNEDEIDIELNKSIINNDCYNLRRYISEDLDYMAIKIDNRNSHFHDILKVRTILSDNAFIKFKDWEWHEAGLPVLRTRYIELVEYERFLFIPLAFLIAALTLIWVFRQLKPLLIALLSISISLVWVSGIMSLMGISINVISYLTFNLLMVIGVSDAIHLLMKYHEESHRNQNKNKSLNNVIIDIGAALFLTSFTTATGFLSLSITNVKILQEFGIIMGIGIGVLFIVTIIVMPIILSYVDSPPQKHIDRLIFKKESSSTYKMVYLVKNYPKIIICTSILTFFLAFYGLTKIDSNVTVLGDLKEGNKLYTDINFVEDNFGGTLPLEIIIPYNDLEPITHNNVFQLKFKDFTNNLIQYKNIKTISGYWELDGTPNFQQHKYINKNRDEIRISCGIENIDSEEAEILKLNILNDYENVFNSQEINITGSTLLSLKMNKYLISSLLSSFVIAFSIIFISMIVLFRSFKLSLVSIIPNILPLIFAGGVMGFMGIELRPATAMTFSIALGIAVDDTIHFLSRFRSEFKISESHEKSTTITILTTGRAIISTTITLAMGFIVLLFSNFKPNSEFGILSTIILVIALISSLLLLPSLINTIKPLKSRGHEIK